MEEDEPVGIKEIQMDSRRRAVREALNTIPEHKVRAILADCGLTEEEQQCLLRHRRGADLIGISEQLHTSDRTVDRRRASALDKLLRELEQ